MVTYLCSRSELFRYLNLDCGTRPLLISPPDGFTDWFNRVLPTSTRCCNNISSVPRDNQFDMIMIWPSRPDGLATDETREIGSFHTGKNGIFICLRVGEGPETGEDILQMGALMIKGPPFEFNTEYDMFRAEIMG